MKKSIIEIEVNENVINIKTSDCVSVELTPNHRVAIDRNGEIGVSLAKNLHIGDIITCLNAKKMPAPKI